MSLPFRIPVFTALFLGASTASSASGEIVSVAFEGHLTFVHDPSFQWRGVYPNNLIRGRFTFDTSSTNEATPETQAIHGFYRMPSPPSGIRVTIGEGSWTDTTPTTTGYYIETQDAPGFDAFDLYSYDNAPAPNGAPVTTIAIQLRDNTGQALSSPLLVNEAPNLAAFGTSRQVIITGGGFTLVGEITSMRLSPMEECRRGSISQYPGANPLLVGHRSIARSSC